MSEGDKGFLAGLFFATAMSIVLTGTLLHRQSQSWRNELVEKGYAEYVVDNTGEVTWQYKTNEK